jgi:ATP-dependent RNA helicase DeaD
MTTPSATPPTAGFAALGLSAPIAAAVAAVGYEEATPIQREAIPILLAGKDLVGQAGTGTGKTAAFTLPMLHRLAARAGHKGVSPTGVRGLILVPTRELAMQVAEAVHKYAKGLPLTVVPLYGGAPMDLQIRALRRGAQIVVATPGRALDHLRRQTLDLAGLEMLVLDEADEMLDMGFAEDLDAILGATPATRQTALFAATMAPRIQAVAARHLKDPVRVTIAREKVSAGKVPRVRQVAYLVAREHKAAALDRVLEYEDPTSAIIFCRTRLEVDGLTDTLDAHGYSPQALHGGMEQRQRDKVMQLFRSGQADVLVATDVAARGLDIDHVSHVINFDVPSAPEVYVHRIGRTGRIGRAGVAISLVDPREHRFVRNIQALTKQKIEVATLPSVEDLQQRRLQVTRAALRTAIEAGGLQQMRDVVAALAQDFDVMDIAAAAVKLVHQAHESVAAASVASPSPAVDKPTSGSQGGGEWSVLWVNVGKRANVGPGDLVGAIAGEAGVEASAVGAIRITEGYSLVEVSTPLADRIIAALKRTVIRGQRVEVRRDRARR